MQSPIAAHLHVASLGAVYFVVQRALDGWIAFDLAGPVTDALRSPRGDAHIVTRGGSAHTGRIFALHDRLDEVARGSALAIGPPRDARFAFGGNLLRLLDAIGDTELPRLRLFRGLTVLRDHDPRLGSAQPATHELVFDTPAELVRATLDHRADEARLVSVRTRDAGRCRASSARASTPRLPTSRSGNERLRA